MFLDMLLYQWQMPTTYVNALSVKKKRPEKYEASVYCDDFYKT